MKKTLLVIIALLLILCSCNGAVTETAAGSNTQPDNGYRPYKYGIVGGDYMFDYSPSGVIMKYNVHNGEASYLCPDPFCRHTSKECQFSGMGSSTFTSIGNVVYYVKQDDSTGKSALYSFDADTAETKTLLNRDGMMTGVYAYEKRLLVLWLEKYELEAERFYFWYDTETGKTEKLGGTVNTYSPTKRYILYTIRDDRIIWRVLNMDKRSYYSTDLYGEDLKEHDFGHRYGNYYTTEKETGEDGKEIYSLYVIYNGETEKKLLKKDIIACLFYENKIVYGLRIPYEKQRVVHVDRDGSEERDEWGGNVYVMDPDGSDDHLLFHTEEYIIGATSDTAHPHVCGDYIGIMTGKFKGDAMTEDNIIIANINTGEYVITHK